MSVLGRITLGVMIAGAVAFVGSASEDRVTSEPKGVRLVWHALDPKDMPISEMGDNKVLITWGLSEAEVMKVLTGGASGFVTGKPSCSEVDHGKLCFLGIWPYNGWYADFGEHFYESAIQLYDDKLYKVVIRPKMSSFDFVRETLSAALGKPKVTKGKVQNRMGATFDTETATWQAGEVDIILAGRGWDIDTALLTMAFRPLEAKVPTKPKAGEPPF